MGILGLEVVGATLESYPMFRCPQCRNAGLIDQDQFRGRGSIVCPWKGCDYHETKDWTPQV